ncbi:hypothetical protein MH1LPH_17380 [Lactiplantibacillus brownii]
MVTFWILLSMLCLLVFLASIVWLIVAAVMKRKLRASLITIIASLIMFIGGMVLYTNASNKENAEDRLHDNRWAKEIKSEISKLNPDTSKKSDYEHIKNQIFVIRDSSKRESLMSDYNSAHEDFNNDVDKTNSSTKTVSTAKISGNATREITSIKSKSPKASQYIKSIDYNSEYGLKVVTKNLKLNTEKNTSSAVGIMEAIMKDLHDSDSSKGIGLMQKSKDGYGLYAIYYKSSEIDSVYSYGTEDFFKKSTSFYVNGSKVQNNPILANMNLNQEGPQVNGKTYVNMLMND